MNVNEVVSTLYSGAGSKPPDGNLEGILAGDPARDVEKLAVCWRATVESIRKSVEQKCDYYYTRTALLGGPGKTRRKPDGTTCRQSC